jgi:Uma2 family endonuclease
MWRFPPDARHEAICLRLHERVSASLAAVGTSRLLAPRSIIQLSPGTMVRPDLTLVTQASGKPWLVAEVIDSDDHLTDTVVKKDLYAEAHMPRLWMVDTRYDNVEVYLGTPYGLSLRHNLAGQEVLTEKLLPAFALTMKDLFEV